MSKKIGVAAVIIMLFCIAACNKFLDKKSDTSLVEPTTLDELQQLLDDAATMNLTATPTYGEISADDYFVPQIKYNALAVSYQQLYIWHTYDHGGNDWGISYEKVYNSNYCLDQLKSVSSNPENEAEWENVKGSALFFRSYYFLELLWDYADAYDSATANKDLGIALRLTSDFNIPSTRATVEQCCNQIINDVKSSIAYLPAHPLNVLRPSKMAAYGLLARCFLSMRDYNDALLYADSALQLNDQLIDYNGDDAIKTTLNASLPFKQFNKETVFYTEMNLSGYLNRTDLQSRIDTVLYASYDSNDLRKIAYFSVNTDGYPSFKGSPTAKISALFSGIATDELYLITAEGYIRAGEVQKGLSYLNTLLEYRYKKGSFAGYANLNQQDALTLVLEERRKELLMRGLRWPDIKRLNKEGRNIILERVLNGQTYTLEPNAGYYALPIPSDIIQLTGMPQNLQ